MQNDPLIGKRLANFQIERLLGHGGMAEVYFGRDISLLRPVAIKIINTRFRDNPDYAERFISEARAVAKWRHENIVQVYYAGKQDNLYYFVMEYIDGMNLSALLEQYASEGELMPHADVVRIASAVASALDYAHKKGVIHRDVKPANTMISTDDRVVLMDFGLALDVQQGSIGEVFGTPHYVSPEQARRSADAGPQSDIYSLGIMVYEMLTGALPFDDPSPTAVALQHLTMPPPLPRSLNRNLRQPAEDVLLKALAKRPDDRYPSATEFIQSLELALREKPAAVATAEIPPPPPGVVPPNLSMSNRTVSERVVLNINQTQTQIKPEFERIPATKKADSIRLPVPPANDPTQATKSTGKTGAIVAVVTVAVIALLAVAVIMISRGNTSAVSGLPTFMPTSDNQVTTIAASATTQTNIPSTPTDIPLIVANAPSDVPSMLPTVTFAPAITDSSPTVASVVPTATSVPLTAIVTPAATILYPNGQPLAFYWNETSFYWYNPAGQSMRVSPLSLEALDANGNSSGHLFNGRRWTIGFNLVEPNKCVAIELLQTSNWLRPSQCRGYNSTLTLQQSSDEVFWLGGGSATQFRVVWNSEEVGRCQLNAQSCEVRIP